MLRDLLLRGNTVANYDAEGGRRAVARPSPDLRSALMTVHGDIRDTYQLNRVVRDQNTDRIIHRASLKVPASVADPPTAVAVVAGGLINVLEAARLSL